MRADASAASHPAWPPPITTTSYDQAPCLEVELLADTDVVPDGFMLRVLARLRRR